MNQIRGSQSISFGEAPYLISSACVAGSKEAEGPLGKLFDMVNQDDLFGAKTWEEAESTMQKEACVLALGKAHMDAKHVRYLYGGDLLRQGIATSMGVEELQIPMFGLYGACSTSGEALALSAMSVAAGYGEYMLAVTSSHFGSAEKGISVSVGVCIPASVICQLDGDGKWSISGRQTEKPCEDHRRDGWEDCGLWTEGFPEYGSVYGTGSSRYHFNKSEGLRKKPDQL